MFMQGLKIGLGLIAAVVVVNVVVGAVGLGVCLVADALTDKKEK